MSSSNSFERFGQSAEDHAHPDTATLLPQRVVFEKEDGSYDEFFNDCQGVELFNAFEYVEQENANAAPKKPKKMQSVVIVGKNGTNDNFKMENIVRPLLCATGLSERDEIFYIYCSDQRDVEAVRTKLEQVFELTDSQSQVCVFYVGHSTASDSGENSRGNNSGLCLFPEKPEFLFWPEVIVLAHFAKIPQLVLFHLSCFGLGVQTAVHNWTGHVSRRTHQPLIPEVVFRHCSVEVDRRSIVDGQFVSNPRVTSIEVPLLHQLLGRENFQDDEGLQNMKNESIAYDETALLNARTALSEDNKSLVDLSRMARYVVPLGILALGILAYVANTAVGVWFFVVVVLVLVIIVLVLVIIYQRSNAALPGERLAHGRKKKSGGKSAKKRHENGQKRDATSSRNAAFKELQKSGRTRNLPRGEIERKYKSVLKDEIQRQRYLRRKGVH